MSLIHGLDPVSHNWIIASTNLLGIIPLYRSWRYRNRYIENWAIFPLLTGIITSSTFMHLSETCYGQPGVCLTRWYWHFLRLDHALCTLAFGFINYNYGRRGHRYTYNLISKYIAALGCYLWSFQAHVSPSAYLISHTLFHIFAYSIVTEQVLTC